MEKKGEAQITVADLPFHMRNNEYSDDDLNNHGLDAATDDELNSRNIDAMTDDEVNEFYEQALIEYSDDVIMEIVSKFNFPHNTTPLHHVCESGYVATLEVMLDVGWNAEVMDDLGWRPLHYAACNGRLSCVELLLDAGVNVDAVDITGFTPLCTAVFHRHFDVAKVLVARGANILCEDEITHWSPLKLAMRHPEDIDIIRELLELQVAAHTEPSGMSEYSTNWVEEQLIPYEHQINTMR